MKLYEIHHSLRTELSLEVKGKYKSDYFFLISKEINKLLIKKLCKMVVIHNSRKNKNGRFNYEPAILYMF